MAPGKSLLDVRGGLSRPDLILAVLPLTFLGIYGIGSVAFDARSVAAAVAAIACCLVVADGLFWHSPDDE